MKLDAARMAGIKRASVILIGAAVVAMGGYWYGTSSAKPKMVAISQTGCGPTSTLGSFGVPLETIKRGSPKIAASYGPVEIPSASALRFEFDPTADGKLREINLIGETLYLPITFGSAATLPERIRVTCRDGAIANVRYESGKRNSQTFAVVRQEVSMLGSQD